MRRRNYLTYFLIVGSVWAASYAVAAATAMRPGAVRAATTVSAATGSSIPSANRMEPAELAALMRSGHAPVILQVGFGKLYAEAHIQGAVHAGPMVSADGRALLAKTVAGMDRHALLVIYCGCCPWEKCPNIRAAFAALHKMGFTNVKALYLADNFGADWVQPGYPTVKGN